MKCTQENFLFSAHCVAACVSMSVTMFLMAFGDGCQLDTGSETVQGQIFAVWDSFTNIVKICTLRI